MFRGEKANKEDKNYEYEMMWDAEGAMHLVKKAADSPIWHPSDKAAVERCFISAFSSAYSSCQ